MGNGVNELRPIFLLILAVILTLLLFSDKAVHMDDPLFVWSAENILKDFARPYDFTINWSGTTDRAWDANKNPPLAAYILAPLIKLFPAREAPLHIAFIIFPLIAVVAMYNLSNRFVENPILPCLFLFISPAFFVTSTGLMCDLPQLAFYLAAIWLYIKGFERARGVYFVLAGLSAGLAVLAKYTAVNVILIFVLYSIIFKKKSLKSAAAILIPLIFLALWGFHGIHFYGRPHFFTLSEQVYFFWEKANPFKEGLINLSEFFIFLSGCSLFVVFSFLEPARRIQTPLESTAIYGGDEKYKGLIPFRKGVVKAPPFLMGFTQWFVICMVSVSLTIFTCIAMARKSNRFDFVPMFLFIAISLWFFKSAFTYYMQNKNDKNFSFLFGWFLLNCVMVVLNYTIAARFILLILPAMALLITYILWKGKTFGKPDKKFVYTASALIFLITFLLARSDEYLAASCRNFSRLVKEMVPGRKIWFVGHWGFQYYMENSGFEPLDFLREISITKGDIIVVPVSNASVYSPKLDAITELYKVYVDKKKGLFSITMNAGFYNHGLGPLPYTPGVEFSEEYQLYEVTKSARLKLL